MTSPANIMFYSEKLKAFPLKIRTKTTMPILITFIQHIIGSPRYGNQQRKRNKRCPNWKGLSKLSFFADDMIPYHKSLKISPKYYQNSSMKSVKLQDTKVICRNLLHFYTLTIKHKETIPFLITSKRIEKEIKDLYLESTDERNSK